MANSEYRQPAKTGGMAWIMAPVVMILILGAALSVGAYFYNDVQLTAAESIAAGFGGLAAIIVGLIAAVFGVLMGLIGALIGLVAAGGAIGITLFIVASPVIAIILIVMLMRKSKACPEPGAHG